jgi:hypothetical protein
MVEACLKAIAPNTSFFRSLQYFSEWLLFGFGHPSQPEAPIEPMCSNKNAAQKLTVTLELEQLIRCPADYFGHLLATSSYGQNSSNRFYPTLQPVAGTMAAVAIAAATNHGNKPPFHAFEPCLGTGRLALALSNHCRSLTGWERDAFLLKVATTNFMLYAPDFALPIPALGGDLICGDTLAGEGRSLITGCDYHQSLMPPMPPMPIKPTMSVQPSAPPQEESSNEQLCLF